MRALPSLLSLLRKAFSIIGARGGLGPTGKGVLRGEARIVLGLGLELGSSSFARKGTLDSLWSAVIFFS